MEKYRIKQVGNRYYPQWKKFLGWGYYKGEPYLDYGPTTFLTLEKITRYNYLYFESYNGANDYLIERKNNNTITYHDIREK